MGLCMLLQAECVPCIIGVRCREVFKAVANMELRFEIMAELLKAASQMIKPDAYTTIVATQLFRLVKKLSNNPDPYHEEKMLANNYALSLFGGIKSLINSQTDSYKRFELACKAAAVGNLIDLGVVGHEFNFEELPRMVEALRFLIDDVPKVYEALRRVKEALYLTDNAGEIVFDVMLVEEVKRLGCKVIVVVKGAPYQNDATLEDAKIVGMEKIADEVIGSGTDASSLILDEFDATFLDRLAGVDMVIAKGMAYVETPKEYLKRIKKPLFFLLNAKCNPVAEMLGVKKGDYVALMKTYGTCHKV